MQVISNNVDRVVVEISRPPSGLIVPGHLAAAVFRLLVYRDPELSQYEVVVPEVCSTLQYLQGTWIVAAYYMSFFSILFRSGQRGEIS